MMRTVPLPFMWPYALVFWAVFIWAFAPESRIVRSAKEPAQRADSPDAGSYRVLVFGMGAASFLAFPVAWIPALQFPRGAHVVLFVLGVAAVISGSLLRRHCWRTLGASFTGDVRARPDQEIVARGAYKYIRHPAYAAGLVMNVGMGLGLGSWASTLLLALATFGVYSYRISVEEKVLMTVVGEPYRAYTRNRKRLVPFIY